jgi:phospholipid N-methyltransferase
MSKIHEGILDSIRAMEPEGNAPRLPSNIHLGNYAAVKKVLLTAGGKYQRCTFVFEEDAAKVQERLLGGEAINDKKEFQFFPTPKDLAEEMVANATIHEDHRILEPSAGQGAICDAIMDHIVEFSEEGMLCTVELMDQNVKALRRKGYSPMHMDFLDMPSIYNEQFDRIIANPPFAKGQDADHTMKMWELLKPGGSMVVIISNSYQYNQTKKYQLFREFLESIDDGLGIYEIPPGRFKESGTTIATTMLHAIKETHKE